ncbi:putative ABC transporter permease [Clostridia bacterium]|nr:putative ABC transporter permease [Clostridia bacterium]
MELSKSIKKTYLYFMMYAIIGWCYEVFLEVVVYQWGFTNRGVLFGPYCPVYGFGALAFILCFGKIMKKKEPNWFVYVKPLIIFMGCAFVATGIELVASYMLEILTGSWPWQTYADYAINFQARIALSPSIRFGLGGLLFLYILQPIFEKVIYKLGDKKVSILFYAILFPFILDLFVKLFKMVS